MYFVYVHVLWMFYMCIDMYVVINRERLGGHEIYARKYSTLIRDLVDRKSNKSHTHTLSNKFDEWDIA